jgi:hypothetical protein
MSEQHSGIVHRTMETENSVDSGIQSIECHLLDLHCPERATYLIGRISRARGTRLNGLTRLCSEMSYQC